MKYLQTIDGEVLSKRYSNEKAAHMVKTGNFEYCSKEKWKEEVRNKCKKETHGSCDKETSTCLYNTKNRRLS